MRNEIKKQFQLLNDQIALSITEKRFDRAILLDKARQDLLQELTIIKDLDLDEDFFHFVEQCAIKNAAMIESVEGEMRLKISDTGKKMRAQRGYSHSF